MEYRVTRVSKVRLISRPFDWGCIDDIALGTALNPTLLWSRIFVELQTISFVDVAKPRG